MSTRLPSSVGSPLRITTPAFLIALLAHGAVAEPSVPDGVVLFNARDAEWTVGGGPGAVRTPIYGDPSQSGAYLHLIKVPPNAVGRARKYTDDRTYTVIAGTWFIGFGDRFDRSRLLELPAGSYYALPAGVAVFNATAGDGATLQIGGHGPTEHIDLEAETSSDPNRR